MTDPVRLASTVPIALGERSYDVIIGDGLLTSPEALRERLLRVVRGRQFMLISNVTVAPLYLPPLRSALGPLVGGEFLLPDGEQHKTLAQLERLLGALLEGRHARTTTLVAVGGGVVGDLTGFAAACYQRGVDFIQIPTTLLAQVDSSVGGKTAVNHPLGKNMIGAFHQPRLVLADTQTLSSLPAREFAAGMAEVIKYGMIADAEFFAWLEVNADVLTARVPGPLVQAIKRSVEIKAAVIAEDERESGCRAILNFGHTFGHALETCTQYRSYLHGEAVAVGMVLAAELSVELGQVPASVVDRLRRLLQRFQLPTSIDYPLSAVDLVDAMGRDKKVVDGRLRLILLEALGAVRIQDDQQAAALVRFLERKVDPHGRTLTHQPGLS